MRAPVRHVDGERGDRIAVLALNCPEYIALLYAVPAAGRILVPLNTRLSPLALQQQLAQVGARLVIGDSDHLAALQQAADDKPLPQQIALGAPYQQWLAQYDDDADNDTDHNKDNPEQARQRPAWLLFTSGTTGRAKVAILTQHSLLAGLDSANCGRAVQAGDRYLYSFPLFHISAHNVLHQHRHGAAVVLLPAFDAEAVLHNCQQHSVTTVSLAPTMIGMLLDHPSFQRERLASLRCIGYGASAINTALLERVQREIGCDLSQGFGMTELSGSIAFLDPDDHRHALREQPQRLQSVGRPVAGIELQLLDDKGRQVAEGEPGEIAVRGAQVAAGYWQQAQETEAAFVGGWLHTGDIGRFDSEGYLYIVDRKKDIIISGGENIASREVEQTLCHHPHIRNAAVVGVADARWGEVVCAMIESEEVLQAEEIRAFCRRQLAGYKAPKRILFGELPLNASGKVDKQRVKVHFAES